MKRRLSRQVRAGSILIGGDTPISVQSMTNTDTSDVHATVAQIKALEASGCEIVRVAVPNMKSASVLGKIKSEISIPLVADIHFDHKLAIRAIDEGIDKLRINPGNIGSPEKVKTVVESAKKNNIPIRIGVNSGSLEKDLLAKYGHPTPSAMVESAMRHIAILEELEFHDIVLSLKASDPLKMISAYRLISEKVSYPLHLGVTEAGTLFSGAIRSAVGIGILLSEGIGDTIRVSLTDDPINEIKAGYEILKSLELREYGATVISCPTCARTKIDIVKIAREVEEKSAEIKKPIKIAVMGCIVNGPGEAREADIGIAGGIGKGILFKKGKMIRSIPENRLVDELFDEVMKMLTK